MPISIFKGMAGTKRLNNYLSLFQEEGITFHSIYHYPEAKNYKSLEFGVSYNGFISRAYAQLKVFSLLLKFKMEGKKNILYFYNYPSILNIHILLFAKLIGFKIIIDVVEDNFTIENYNSKAARIKYFTARLLMEKIGFIANGIVVISSHLEKLALGLSNGKCPIVTIPITIDISEFGKKINIRPQRLNTIFYGGSFGQKDGLQFLLKAFDVVCETHNCNLVITGRGSEADMKRFYTDLDQVKYKEYVFYLGFLEREEYIKQMMQADIHCMTRTNSAYANAGFPFKLGEMLATGKPVVCSNVGEIDLYLKHKESAIIVEPENCNQISEAINLLLDNKKLAQHVGEIGRTMAYKFFDNKTNAQKLIHFCEEL